MCCELPNNVLPYTIQGGSVSELNLGIELCKYSLKRRSINQLMANGAEVNLLLQVSSAPLALIGLC